jgi:hypothetical protein
MGSDVSYSDGEFRFWGMAYEMTTIDPFLEIEHGCNTGKVSLVMIIAQQGFS